MKPAANDSIARLLPKGMRRLVVMLGDIMTYDLLFRDHGGHIFSRASLVADSHEVAIERARRIYHSGFGAGYEIWTEGQHVHTEGMLRTRK